MTLAAALMLWVVGAVPTGAAAQQSVAGTVTGSRSGAPLEGVLVRLVRPSGQEVTGTFTDTEGHFRLEPERPGRFRLEAQRIGYRGHRGETFLLELGSDVTRNLALEPEGVGLSELTVTSRKRCNVDPDGGRATHRLWRDVERALEAAEWAAGRGLLEIRTRAYRRRLDPNLEVEETLSEREAVQAGVSPYRSLAAETLSERGYVDTRGDTHDYYAPDAETLVSDAFQRDHCFWVTREDAPEPGWVGLAFRPVEGRELPDVEGVLWLEEATSELKRLTFDYVNLGIEVSSHAAGGEVAFFRLPSGPWIVEEWRIRMPLVAKENLRIAAYHREEFDIAGYQEQGGQVLRLTTARGRILYDFERATLAGVVYDSLRGRRLEGARVELLGTGHGAVTDARGRFRIPGVQQGAYRAVFRHPALDRLGLEPPEQVVQVRQGELVESRLALPGPETLARQLCPDANDDGAVLVGRVTGPEGQPAGGARVAVVWPGDGAGDAGGGAGAGEGAGDRRGDPGDAGRHVHREVTADAEGRFRLCGVPSEAREVAVRASVEGGISEVERIGVEGRRLATADLALQAGHGADQLAGLIQGQGLGGAETGATTGGAEGPPAAVVGRVQAADAGRPLAAAEIRVGDERVAVTDSAGRFRLEELAPGTHRIRVSYLGFASREALLRAAPGDTVRPTFLLETRPVPLPELTVRVEGRGRVAAKMAGFERRMERGRGHFLTREELAEVPGDRLSDALRKVPGLRVVPCRSGGSCTRVAPTRSSGTRLSLSRRDPGQIRNQDEQTGDDLRSNAGSAIPNPDTIPGGRACEVAYFVDGAPTPLVVRDPNNPRRIQAGLEQIAKSQVEALEVYTGPAQIPAQFRTGMCTRVAIVIWTRTGGS